MGEIIKVLAKKKLRDQSLQIELNKPHAVGFSNSVHIQTDFFRWEMTDSQYLLIALSTLKAIEKFKQLKKIKNE